MEKDGELKGEGNSYDFGARMYDPRIGKWLSVDPMQAKYPDMSPFNFANNNPIYYIDPDGRDGKAATMKGAGTKKSPHIVVVTANYYYNKNTLSDAQVASLNRSISKYNKSNYSSGDSKKGTYTEYVFQLNAIPVESDDEARANANKDAFKASDGSDAYFGNVVTPVSHVDSEDGLGDASSSREIRFGTEKVGLRASEGFSESEALEGIFIHEIGHNLGAIHGDAGKIMKGMKFTTINSTDQLGKPLPPTFSIDGPKVDKSGIGVIINRIDQGKGKVGDEEKVGQILTEKKE